MNRLLRAIHYHQRYGYPMRMCLALAIVDERYP